jgi:hypothetical protein
MRVFQAANYDNLSQIPEKNGVLTLLVLNLTKHHPSFNTPGLIESAYGIPLGEMILRFKMEKSNT